MEKYKDILLGMLLGILIAYLMLPKKVLMITSEKEFNLINTEAVNQ